MYVHEWLFCKPSVLFRFVLFFSFFFFIEYSCTKLPISRTSPFRHLILDTGDQGCRCTYRWFAHLVFLQTKTLFSCFFFFKVRFFPISRFPSELVRLNYKMFGLGSNIGVGEQPFGIVHPPLYNAETRQLGPRESAGMYCLACLVNVHIAHTSL